MFFFSSRRRHTRYWRDWSSDVCSSDLHVGPAVAQGPGNFEGLGRRLLDGLALEGAESVEGRASLHLHAELADGSEEIGRASCRERECNVMGACTVSY